MHVFLYTTYVGVPFIAFIRSLDSIAELPACTFTINNLMVTYKDLYKQSTMRFVLVSLALDGVYNSK